MEEGAITHLLEVHAVNQDRATDGRRGYELAQANGEHSSEDMEIALESRKRGTLSTYCLFSVS